MAGPTTSAPSSSGSCAARRPAFDRRALPARFGETTFLSAETMRSGEIVAMAQDAIDLADALGLEKIAVVGHDWGARIAYALALMTPQRLQQAWPRLGGLATRRTADTRPPTGPGLLVSMVLTTKRGRQARSDKANRWPGCSGTTGARPAGRRKTDFRAGPQNRSRTRIGRRSPGIPTAYVGGRRRRTSAYFVVLDRGKFGRQSRSRFFRP